MTLLFRKSFPDYLLDIHWQSPVDLAVVPLFRPPKIDWLIDIDFTWDQYYGDRLTDGFNTFYIDFTARDLTNTNHNANGSTFLLF